MALAIRVICVFLFLFQLAAITICPLCKPWLRIDVFGLIAHSSRLTEKSREPNKHPINSNLAIVENNIFSHCEKHLIRRLPDRPTSAQARVRSAPKHFNVKRVSRNTKKKKNSSTCWIFFFSHCVTEAASNFFPALLNFTVDRWPVRCVNKLRKN